MAKLRISFFLAALALFSACKGRQEVEYDRAVALEKTARHDQLPAAVSAFEAVASLDPTTPLATQALSHASDLRARIAKGEETHKDVFQEHGVD